MAKKKNYYSISKKGVIAIVLIIVILAGLFTSSMLTNGYTEGNKFCLDSLGGHKYDDNGFCVRCGAENLDEIKPNEPGIKLPTEDEILRSGIVATIFDEKGINLATKRLAHLSDPVSGTYIHDSYVLTATVTPSYATDTSVDWTIRWKNADSDWATGKNVEEHCTITPESDGALKATLRNLRDFGEQIEVVVTSRDNPEAQAICLVDYVQRITGFTFNMPEVSAASTPFTYSVETTAYTIKSDVTLTTSDRIFLTEEFKNAFCAAFYAEYSLEFARPLGDFFSPTVVISDNAISFKEFKGIQEQDPEIVFSGAYFGGSGALWDLIILNESKAYDQLHCTESYLIDTIASRVVSNVSGAHATFDLSYQAIYDGTIYSSGSMTVEVRFDGSVLHIPVENVSMSDDRVVF